MGLSLTLHSIKRYADEICQDPSVTPSGNVRIKLLSEEQIYHHSTKLKDLWLFSELFKMGSFIHALITYQPQCPLEKCWCPEGPGMDWEDDHIRLQSANPVAYSVIAWALLQVCSPLIPNCLWNTHPNWILKSAQTRMVTKLLISLVVANLHTVNIKGEVSSSITRVVSS